MILQRPLKFLTFLLLSMALLACGGGESKNDEGDKSVDPIIETISVNKVLISVSDQKNSSQELVLSIDYDNDSSDSQTLTLNWNSSTQTFNLDGEQYQLELIDDTENQKILRIIETASQKSVELTVAIENIVDLIEGISLNSEQTGLLVGESLSLSVELNYSSGENIQTLPEGISCSLQEGEGIVSITNDCQVTALAAGVAKVTLSIPTDLLAAEVDLPVVEINVAEEQTIPEPQISEITVSTDKQKIFTGDTFSLSVTANYDNDPTDVDIRSQVNCIKLSGDAETTINNCELTAVSAGKVTVGVELKEAQINSPSVVTLTLTIIEPQVIDIELDLAAITVLSSVSSQHPLVLLKKFDNEQDETVNLNLQWQHSTQTFIVTDSFSFEYPINFDSTSGKLVVTEPESNLSDEITVQVSSPGISKLYFDTASLQAESGQSYDLVVMAEFNDGSDPVIYNDNIACSDNATAPGLIGIGANCSKLFAWFPGNYQIAPVLKDASQAAPGIEIQPLDVTVTPANLGSLADASSFVLNQFIDSSAIVFEIDGATQTSPYKLSLSATNGTGITQSINFHALSELIIGQGCSNAAVYNELSVACGLQATNNKIYIFLETLDKTSFGTLAYQLDIQPDADILHVDGNYFAEEYVKLTVGNTFTGHVAANDYGFNNISMYKTDVLNGMNPEGGNYEISIMFKSPYYQDDSVVVLHDSDAFNDPIIDDAQCANNANTQTISCQVLNAEKPQQIIIQIYGNGSNLFSLENSKTAVDGEVEYDITITQN